MPRTPRRCTLINPRDASPICEDVTIARTFLTRLIGLLGRCTLRDGEGLWLQPSRAVHTLFMRFPIDVVAFDRHGTVLQTSENVRPWRILPTPRRTRSILELPAGHLRRHPLAIGDHAWPAYA